jgi:DNA-binding HxlR family transcriptional regulator
MAYRKKVPETLPCGLDVALKVMGGKWKARLIDCIHQGIRRPSALRNAIPGTSDRLLREQLRELAGDGLVRRKIVTNRPLHVEYSLTRLGVTLLPVLEALDLWGEAHRARILK